VFASVLLVLVNGKCCFGYCWCCWCCWCCFRLAAGVGIVAGVAGVEVNPLVLLVNAGVGGGVGGANAGACYLCVAELLLD
jgi:hypothetical protein